VTQSEDFPPDINYNAIAPHRGVEIYELASITSLLENLNFPQLGEVLAQLQQISDDVAALRERVRATEIALTQANASPFFCEVDLLGGGMVPGTEARILRQTVNNSVRFDIPLPDVWGDSSNVGGLWARSIQEPGVRVRSNITGDVVILNNRPHLRVRFSPIVADNTIRLTIINPRNSLALN